MKERTGTVVSDGLCFGDSVCAADGFCAATRVPLLDGTQDTLQALTGCGDFWVYSIGEDQRIAPGKARARQTNVQSPLVRVVVSGGEQVICSPSHRFMLSDGSYKQAGNLRFNDSLMPLYRKWDQRDGYESASSGKGTARATHLLVYDHMNGSVPRGHVVHHVNHNHFDNSPSNLELLSAAEHSRHHRNAIHSRMTIQASRLLGSQGSRGRMPTRSGVPRWSMSVVGTSSLTCGKGRNTSGNLCEATVFAVLRILGSSTRHRGIARTVAISRGILPRFDGTRRRSTVTTTKS